MLCVGDGEEEADEFWFGIHMGYVLKVMCYVSGTNLREGKQIAGINAVCHSYLFFSSFLFACPKRNKKDPRNQYPA